MKKFAATVLASAMLVLSMSACEVPEDDGKNAAERASEDRKAAKADKGKDAKAKPEKAAPAMTPGQENALAAAEQYLDYSAFSHSGLIKQLKFDKYSEADATWAVNHVKVDWNEQAAASAEQYLEYSAFSRDGLIQQLKFDGYTDAQAAFGTKAAGL